MTQPTYLLCAPARPNRCAIHSPFQVAEHAATPCCVLWCSHTVHTLCTPSVVASCIGASVTVVEKLLPSPIPAMNACNMCGAP